MPTYEEYEQVATPSGMILARHSWDKMTDTGRQRLFDTVSGKIKPLLTYDELAAQVATLAQQHQEAVARAAELGAEVQALIRGRASIILDLMDTELGQPEAEEPAPFAITMSPLYQNLQQQYYTMKQRAQGAEQQLAVVGAASRWIPVTERLPAVVASHGHSNAVQIWLGDHAANFTGFYSGSSWYRWGQAGKLKNVSHWRELDCNTPENYPAAPPLEREAAALPVKTCQEASELLGLPHWRVSCPAAVAGVNCCNYSCPECKSIAGGPTTTTGQEKQPGGAPLEGSSPAESELLVVQGHPTAEQQRQLTKQEPQVGTIWQQKKKPTEQVIICPSARWDSVAIRRHPHFGPNSDFNRLRYKKTHYFLYEYEQAAGSPASEKGDANV